MKLRGVKKSVSQSRTFSCQEGGGASMVSGTNVQVMDLSGPR